MVGKPRVLKIGPDKITCGWTRKELLSHKEMGIVNGLYLPEQKRILVDGTMAHEKVRRIFTHEVIHALVDTYAINFPTDKDEYNREEKVVERLSMPFQRFIIDNPHAVRWLQDTMLN